MTHPHIDATYKLVPQQDGEFRIEVFVLGALAATVSRFETAADAEQWVIDYRIEIAKTPAPRTNRLIRVPTPRADEDLAFA